MHQNHLMSFLRLPNSIWYTAFIAIVSFPLFQNLGDQAIQYWDEAINATNALEMYENREFFVRYYGGVPDMWQVKPPLLIWLQIASFKLFGISEFSFRLPSAVSALLLCVTLAWFFGKEFNLKKAGFAVGIALVASQGFTGHHVARTGDHEALLVLFMMGSLLMFYKYFSSGELIHKYLYFATAFLIAGTYTKSLVPLMFLPSIFIYALYKRMVCNVIKSPHFYGAVVFYFMFAMFYYLFRESINPGYLNAVWHEEFFDRYSGEDIGFWRYLILFNSSRYLPWIYILPFAVWISLKFSTSKLKDFFILLTMTGILFFLIISNGSKKPWYDAPLYPIFACFIGYSIYIIAKGNTLNKTVKFVAVIFYAGALLFSYSTIVYRNSTTHVKLQKNPEFSIPYFLRNKIEEDNFNGKYEIFYSGYESHLRFYALTYQIKGGEIRISRKLQKFQKGDTILVSLSKDISLLLKKYEVEPIDSLHFAKAYCIKGEIKR